jgi:cysteinyl-tRNA synthetase
MTVYDFCHLGHARVLITFDVIARSLRYLGYRVKHVQNITDIDDKIINRAHQNDEPISALTERFIQAMHEDSRQLNILPPDIEPRATEFITEIIQMIQTLMDKGVAYQGQKDVYFDVSRFEHYGQLSHQHLDELKVGARIEAASDKRNPLDFVLWKASKPNEPAWDSPFGKGRPGWHIECSAMSTHCLAPHIDIHGGGADLLFPHHENEIAQSEAATGEKFVNIWMHVGYLQINHEKMSKSLGNYFTIRDVLDKWNAEILRYFMLTAHYRSPIDYTEEGLSEAQQAVTRLYLALDQLPPEKKPIAPQTGFGDELDRPHFDQLFIEAIEDDFNTPKALAVLFELAHAIQRLKQEGELEQAAHLAAQLKKMGGILGFLQSVPSEFLKGTALNMEEVKKIESLIKARHEAREKQDYETSDRIRAELAEMNILLEDQPTGKTSWRRMK